MRTVRMAMSSGWELQCKSNEGMTSEQQLERVSLTDRHLMIILLYPPGRRFRENWFEVLASMYQEFHDTHNCI